jgi:hypothetical protein
MWENLFYGAQAILSCTAPQGEASRQTVSRRAELQLRAQNMSSHLEWAVEIQYVSRASLKQSDPHRLRMEVRGHCVI